MGCINGCMVIFNLVISLVPYFSSTKFEVSLEATWGFHLNLFPLNFPFIYVSFIALSERKNKKHSHFRKIFVGLDSAKYFNYFILAE